jgi:tRNA A-37 threonylcarbamoyl transferase component Bud32
MSAAAPRNLRTAVVRCGPLADTGEVVPLQQVGSYRVERLLGVGSFATVWLGHDAALGARVAIKVLADNWSHDLRVHERFLDEGRLLWRLDDPRIVRVHALGELADGRPYLVMAWADGGSLQERLARGPVPPGSAVRLLGEVCAGVAVLHDHGVVHRDLTPGNVLFSGSPERVIIADLGLAKALAAASGLTARAGTPGYMAPEQDDPLSVVDRRADVYGLGRLGVRLLAEALPGHGEPFRLRAGVPRPVADVLRRATAYDPAGRYPDAAALGTALDRAAHRRPPAGPLGRAVSAATAVLLLGALVLGTLASDDISGRFVARPGVAVDASRRMAVDLPAGWHARTGPWDAVAAGGHGGTALIISPDPDRWPTDATLPGAFLGLSRDISVTPAEFLARRQNSACRGTLPPRTLRQGGVEWTIAGFRDCPDGRPRISEAVGVRPGVPGLVHVQMSLVGGQSAEDRLLAGLRLR